MRHIIEAVLRENISGAGEDVRLGDNSDLVLGTGNDVRFTWDGTDLDVTAAADDAVIKWGTGTNSFDQWWYGEAAADYILWDASLGDLSFAGDAYIRPKMKIENKLADYTLTAADFGKIFTNRGDGDAITFTLPAATGNEGEVVWFFSLANYSFTVATATADTLVTEDDLNADSIAFATTNEIIGGGFMAVCDGTGWIVVPMARETQGTTKVS
jgi:hypothetical protein